MFTFYNSHLLKHNPSYLICGTKITAKPKTRITCRFIMRMCDNIFSIIFDDKEIRNFIFL